MILSDTYKEMGHSNFIASKEDVRSYMKMVDSDGDGKITLDEFETLVLKSLEKAGIQIYE